jgi:cytochrome c oxidase subunit II
MRTPKGRRWQYILLLVAIALLATGCAEDAPQDVFRPAGPDAEKAQALWNIVFPIAVAIFVIVEGLLVFAVIKFRHKPGRQASQFHGNTKLEVLLTAVPALILAGIAVPTVRTIFELAEERPGSLRIQVVAHQFWWEYRYPELGIVTANEMHIPVGQPVRVELQGGASDTVDGSAEVIHSFWVPRLAGTQDIVPGRTNFITMQADEAGTFYGQCKEYCGLSHANMRLLVFAEPPDDFQQWVEDLQAEAPTTASEGATLFAEGQFANGPACASCHAVDATLVNQPSIGPNLDGFANRTTFAGATFDNDETLLRDWLAGPAEVRPGSKMPDLGLTGDQIDALVEYLESLE